MATTVPVLRITTDYSAQVSFYLQENVNIHAKIRTHKLWVVVLSY